MGLAGGEVGGVVRKGWGGGGGGRVRCADPIFEFEPCICKIQLNH